MKLHYQLFPENLEIKAIADQTPLLIIPGLFGSTANWRSFARNYSHWRPVITIDQRNHGQSPHSDSHSYADMVQDLQDFCDDHGLEKIIPCGHSMGGKVAMLFALQNPDRVEKMVVMDIAPIQYGHSHAPFLEQLMLLDLSTLASRGEAERALRETIPDTATRLFLLQSLRGSAGSYVWRLNIPVLHEYMDEITDFPLVDSTCDVPTLFIAGDLSDYLLPEQHDKISQMFPNAQFSTVAEAGHWLHAEQPEQVQNLLKKFVDYDRK